MTDTCDEYLLDWSRYHDVINNEFMWDFDHKSIVEIGAFTGAQTQIINRHVVKSLTLIEPNALASQELAQKYPQARVITEDIFEVYRVEDLSCDIVVCLGLLYHLHSPLYLLETIVNFSNPEIIVLDSVHCEFLGQSGLMHEPINIPGNMFGKRKIIPRAVAYPFNAVSQGMQDLGYRMTKYRDLSDFVEISQKSNCWTARWEKV